MCLSGLGGSLEGHPFPCPARVAQRQRLPLARTSATYAFFSSMLWEHFQNPHWDWKHLDSPARSVAKLFTFERLLQIWVGQLHFCFPHSGLILFLCLGTLTMLRPNMYFMAPLQEKVVFGMFFLGAVLCLSFSWLFHTVYCHSEKVSRTFSK